MALRAPSHPPTPHVPPSVPPTPSGFGLADKVLQPFRAERPVGVFGAPFGTEGGVRLCHLSLPAPGA